MTSGLYDYGRQSFLAGGFNWIDATIMAAVYAGPLSYRFSEATAQVLDDIINSAKATAGPLTSKTVTNGVAGFAASQFQFSLSAGSAYTIDTLVLYQDSGVPLTSVLIAHFDIGPYVKPTSGLSIIVKFPTTGNKLFKL